MSALSAQARELFRIGTARKELPELFDIGRQFIPRWPIIRMKLKSLLDGSEPRSLLAE